MKELINKLGLIPTNIQIGRTCMYDITIYSLFDKFYIAECDTLGEPTPGKCIVYEKDKPVHYGYFYIDFLKDMPVSELKQILFRESV